jgi:hypothetical protein
MSDEPVLRPVERSAPPAEVRAARAAASARALGDAVGARLGLSSR